MTKVDIWLLFFYGYGGEEQNTSNLFSQWTEIPSEFYGYDVILYKIKSNESNCNLSSKVEKCRLFVTNPSVTWF